MRRKFAKLATSIVLAAAMLTTNSFGPVNVYAGTVVGQVDFEDGVGLPWHTCQTNPASQSFEISGGTYNVTIENPGGASRGGEDRWDLQLRHRGLKIEAGHTYKVTFDINASNAGKLCAKIGNLAGDKELWHNAQGLTETNTNNALKPDDPNQSWDLLEIQEGDNHFECTFTAKESLEVAEWAFHYGGSGKYTPSDCFPVGTVLKFDNLSLECTTCGEESGDGCNWDTTNEMGYVTPRSDVRLNQVGYYTTLTKIASYATDQEVDPVTFVIKNASGKTVFEGTGVSKGYDEASGEYVQLLDFTNFKDAGTGYYIEVSDTANVQTNKYTKEEYEMYKSHSFDVVDPANGNVYEGVLTNALNYYYQNRSGVEIESQYITSGDKEKLAHQAGHTNDTAYVQSKWVKAYASDGSDVDKTYQIDCTGGWYDAGDHGKYVVNGGISVWTLQNMYEMSKLSGTESKWNDGETMSIPQTTKNTPDILDEARVELEWMFKMIVKSEDPYYGKQAGMVYHKMHDHKWTGLAVEAWNYADDWGTIRIVKPPSTAATLNVAATAAQAARLWKGIDDDFAAECLANAKLTYEAAKANPDVYAPLDQAIGGGAYGDDYVEDDFYWAACELYAATGDQTYYNDLSKYKNANDSTGNDKAFSLTTSLGGGENSGSFSSFNWGCTAGLGTLTLYLNQDGLSDTEKASVENAIVSAADKYIAQEDSEGMGIPYRGTIFTDSINIGEGVEVNGYEWGSNSFVVNNAMVMAYAYKIKGTNEYMSGVSTALDYVFGRNGLGISYVTGTGDYYTENPHHRYWSNELDSSFPKAPAGVMSGGAGSGLQDPYVGGLGYTRGKEAPQKCYVDSAEAWSVNEVTINWNAPFAWVLSFMEDEAATVPDADGTTATTEKKTTEEKTTEEKTTTEKTTEEKTTAEKTTEDGKVTEEQTESTTTTTEKATEEQTTTEATTKAPTTTEAETEATTEATTQKPTKAPTTTEAETEATTEATTQKPTKAPTTTEVATEGLTTTEAQKTTEKQTEGTTTSTEKNTEDSTSEEVINVESVQIKTKEVTISRGDAQNLELEITPANATNTTAKWESSDTGIVGVSQNGTITANKAGTATITVTVGGKKATCEVTVTEPVAKVTLDADTISIVAGDTKTLTATVEPENATNKKLTWKSSNTDVATVDANGKVTGIEAGEAVISVVSEDGSFTDTCKVHVTAQTVAADGVKLDITETSLAEGQKTTLKATVTPETATNKNVKWSSSDESVAKVNANGEVEAVKAGTATITVETEDGEFKKECTITVVAAKKNVQSVTITTAPTSLVVGGTMQLTYSIAPETATDKSVKWQSSDPKVLSVDENGVITANKVGEAYISVTTNDGSFTDGVMITVADAKIPVESISLPATPITLVEGEEKVVDLTITPANATERKIIWSSSNESVVTVDANGIVKAVGQGEATITATTTEGKQATCTVVVSKKAVDASVKVTDIILNPQSGSVDVGEQIVLTAYAFPDNATNKNIKWTTSDASIATVVNGVVTGKKAGNVTITATAEDGSGVSATCAIKVNGTESTAVDKVEIEQSSAELEVGESTTLTVNITPANADDKSLTWKSEDQSIAIVDSNGKVTAVAPGTTIVTVTTSNGKNASIPVKVTAKATTEETKVDVERVFVKEEGTTVTLNVGDTKTFTATVYPENASNKTVTWLSTDTDVADFASSLEGKLTAKKAGTTTIKVISADGKASTSFTVVVPGTGTTEQEPVTPTEVQITGLKLDKEQLTIDANTAKTATVTATIEPENAANKNVRFVSLNKSIATVDQTGKITAVANGNVVIAVLTEKGDFVQFCEVEVKNVAVQKDPEPVVTDTLKLSASTATIIPKQQFQLSATLKSTGNAAEGVTWSSTNPSKIKVDANGKVTAVATGTASVIATSADGTLSAVCNITVKSAKTTTLRYEITKFTSSAKEVRVTKAAKSSLKTVNIPKTVKLCGVTYKVVAVKDGAFKNNKKIRKVTIGQNVTKIGKQSFYGCKALKTLVIKSTKLTSAKVGSQAFASGAKAVTVSVPASKKASYKKILIKKGLSKKSTFKK